MIARGERERAVGRRPARFDQMDHVRQNGVGGGCVEARVDIPSGITIGKVRKAMDEVAEAENLDIDVRSLVGKGG